MATAAAPLSCADFLREHWRGSRSRPGAAWAQSLMGLGDIRKMVGSWPIRFFKNHATASLHKPNSGFLADFRWERGREVPADIVEVALREERTLVMHNLEVYWPPVSQLIRSVVRFFHTYTQVNLYMSPSELEVATAPHQDAHSVFIVQVHGAKRCAFTGRRARGRSRHSSAARTATSSLLMTTSQWAKLCST